MALRRFIASQSTQKLVHLETFMLLNESLVASAGDEYDLLCRIFSANLAKKHFPPGTPRLAGDRKTQPATDAAAEPLLFSGGSAYQRFRPVASPTARRFHPFGKTRFTFQCHPVIGSFR